MMRGLSRTAIEDAFRGACYDELQALKPGNVHRYAPGHGMDTTFFERAADAAAPWICDPALSVGKRILRATEASFAATGVNTNLGIVLLCAPLAKAAADTDIGLGLRRRLANILEALDEDDADDTFAAIRLANPAGLGTVDKGDVRFSNPRFTLIEAMQMAADRDRIANAYVTAYSDVFDFAIPIYEKALADADDVHLATTTVHMMLLAEFLDSHIVRKHGLKAAHDVRDAAISLKPKWFPIASSKTLQSLTDFDMLLKNKGLNPGTTADFVVTTLFAVRIQKQKQP